MTRNERQKVAIEKWIKSGGRGTLQWCTGSGKTRAGLLAIKSFINKNTNKKVVVIVPTEYLRDQWLSELIKFNLYNYVSVEIINSAIKFNTSIDFLILDEVHRMAADTFFKVFAQRTPRLVLGLSATFNRLDGKHAILAFHCPVIDTLTISEALENEWLSPYTEYKVSIEADDIDQYKEENIKFLNAFAYFQNDFTLTMNCVNGIRKGKILVKPSHFVRYEYAQTLCTLDKYHPRYKEVVSNIFKEVTAMAFVWSRALHARKNYVANHSRKLELTRQILEARPYSKAITFSATIKQAEKIKYGYVVHSGKTKKKNKLTMEEFAKLSVGVINTAKSLDEGADIPGLNLAVILSNTSSQTQKTQRIGRIIRFEEGKKAEVFTLVIKGTMEENWYSTSNVGKQYIEINEQELEEVLNYSRDFNSFQEGKEMDKLFRF